MLKKLLSLILAAFLAVSPLAAFAEDELPEAPIEVLVIDENFNSKTIEEAWGTENGTSEFSGDDYGYLKFTANSDDAVLQRALGIAEGSAFTVDFRVKAESNLGYAEISAGGYVFGIDFESKSAIVAEDSFDFIPSLWYDVRIASDGSAADVYLDAKKIGEGIEGSFEDAFKVTLSNSSQIGIDDFKLYNYKKVDELKSTPLDFKFEEFVFHNNADAQNENPAPTITTTEAMKTVKTDSWITSVQGEGPVFGTNFSSAVSIDNKNGLFGKSVSDESIYINHVASGYSSYSDSTLDFSIGEAGYLPSNKDKQVISFNLAFSGEKPEDLIIRTFNIYEENGAMVLGGKAGQTSAVAGSKGQVMRIVGESMYLFGDTTYYPIRPALLPDQWNNIRLELISGNATAGSTSGSEYAMYINAYVNDMVVAKNVKVKASEYYVRDKNNDAALRGLFKGVHRLQFNYNWKDERKTVGGLYIDDVKVQNYYSGANNEDVESPIIQNEKGSLSLDKFAEASDGWTDFRNDKWVQGNVVYVDSESTLQDYKDSLIQDRNKGIIFRNASGEEITDLTQKIGDITYAEIIRTDYSRIYVSLIGENTFLEEFTLNGDEAFDTSWDVNGVENNTIGAWDADGKVTNDAPYGVEGGDDYAVVSEEPFGGKSIEENDKVLKIAAASDGSEKITKFSFFRKNGNVPTSSTPSVYTKADYFRPITFEGSILMPDYDSTLNIKTINMWGPYKSLPYPRASSQLNHHEAVYSLIHFEEGYITARTPMDEAESLQLGTYEAGEWNKIAFTVYPGYGRYRIDVAINGKTAGEYIYISKGGNISHQAIVWLMLNTVGDVYIDDFKATTGFYDYTKDNSIKLSASDEAKSAISPTGDAIMLKNAITAGAVKAALASAGTVRVYEDNSYASLIDDNENIKVGNVVVVENSENVIEYFAIEERAITFFKDNEEVTAASYGDEVTASTFASGTDAVLVVAQYGNNGLTGINISSEKPDNNGKVSVSFTVNSETTEIKAMLLGSIETIMPEMEAIPLQIALAE